MPTMTESSKTVRESALIALILIFVLNDFLLLSARDYRAWLAVDYGSRIAALTVIGYLLQQGIACRCDFGLIPLRFGRGTAWALVLSATGVLIDQFLWRWLELAFGQPRIASFPVIPHVFLRRFDLTAGIALISLSEELIFRGFFYSVMREHFQRTWVLIGLSAFVFGVIHWSMGLHAVLATAAWGVLPMIATIRTGSIYPAVAAHFVTDAVSLSGAFLPQ